MENTTTAAAPREAADPGTPEGGRETGVPDRSPAASQYIVYVRTASSGPVCTEPIYAELVGQWRAQRRTVPAVRAFAPAVRL